MPLTVPANADWAFQEASALIEAFFNPERFALGGGTALAARWGHRRPTDLDFFGEFEELLPVLDEREKEIRERLPELCPSCDPESLCVRFRAGFSFRSGETPVFVLTYSPTVHVPEAAEAVEGGRVRAEPAELALDTKLILRMATGRRFRPSDVYDLVYAGRFHPDAVRPALMRLPSTERVALAAQLRRLPDDWGIAGGRILEPRLDLAPAALRDEFERLLLDDGPSS